MNKKQMKVVESEINHIFAKIASLEDLVYAHLDDAERCARRRQQIDELYAEYNGIKKVLYMMGCEVHYSIADDGAEYWAVAKQGR